MNRVYYYFKSTCCKEIYRSCIVKSKIKWYVYDHKKKWKEVPIPHCQVVEITEGEAFVEML